LPFSEVDWASLRSIWDGLAELLSAIPLGALGVMGWRSVGAHSRTTGFVIGLMIVVGIEVAQVFISSHAATGTDVLYAAIGVALGVEFGRRLVATTKKPTNESFTRVVSRQALALVCLWVAVLCAYHWRPYDFGVDTEDIRRKLGQVSLLPFAGYRSGSYLNALNNLLTKVSLALPLGVLAAFVLKPTSRIHRVVTAGWLVFGVAVFAAIECGQFFLPTRLPDPTDVLVGALGTYAGLRLGYWLAGRR